MQIKMTMILYKTKRVQTVVSQLAHSFNQRARDSSSLERTKGKPTIHRFKCGLDRGFLFVISARRGLKSATEMRQLQRGFVRIPEHLPEDLIKNE